VSQNARSHIPVFAQFRIALMCRWWAFATYCRKRRPSCQLPPELDAQTPLGDASQSSPPARRRRAGRQAGDGSSPTLGLIPCMFAGAPPGRDYGVVAVAARLHVVPRRHLANGTIIMWCRCQWLRASQAGSTHD
jgi:hypothetical protein